MSIGASFILDHSLTATFIISIIISLMFLFCHINKAWKLAVWGVAVIFGLISNHIGAAALPYLVATVVMAYVYKAQRNWALQTISGIILTCLILSFSYHLVPGFHNYLVFRNIIVSPNAYPFTLYLNFDSGLIGGLLLLFFCPLLPSLTAFFTTLIQSFRPLLLSISAIAALSCAVGFIQIDPKFPSWFIFWVINNLFLTCVLEETFFRGFLQSHFLPRLFKKLPSVHTLSWLLASILFGLKHLPNGGLTYAALATFSGLGYGWVKQRRDSIEMAILTHFLLNVLHLLLFTYPGLVSL